MSGRDRRRPGAVFFEKSGDAGRKKRKERERRRTRLCEKGKQRKKAWTRKRGKREEEDV